MAVAAGLMLWQQTARGQQPPGRRVDDSVLRSAGTTGEDWLTDLSTADLRDLVALRDAEID